MQKSRLYFAFLLFPISLIYGLAVFIRNLLFDAGLLKSTRFQLPVLSVGNITAGGTGKTPHVEYIADLIRSRYRVAVLSRGYKRKTKGFLLAGAKSTADEIGDESRQIKNMFPDIIVAVDNKRVHGIKRLMAEFPDLETVILDDAFQHRHVRPDLSIVLIDHERPVFRDFLLPLGNLRECPRNINRADTVIVTKCPQDMNPEKRKTFVSKLHLRRRQPVFFTSYRYGNLVPVFAEKAMVIDQNKKRNDNPGVLLVTGIADSRPLKMYINQTMTVAAEMRFGDHHLYSIRDIRAIEKRFIELPAERKIILTTEKDATKLRELAGELQRLHAFLYYIPVQVNFLDEGRVKFEEMVKNLVHD
jgi:tetraacyldisaccharide 4'-kinase